MNSFVVILLLVSLSVANSHNIMSIFPTCNEFSQLMSEKFKELRDNGEITRDSCQGSRAECMKVNMEKVRCAIDAEPSEECMAEVQTFMKGGICSK
ncbi:hypothetical protein CEXT_465081 [Caerostris extrusa]|uniref:Uncharacterized protein n=1 Tax=Caerostris extrusa TaxID=172846 RepID=A0AAV4YFI0_CAEEX|nr:hypothetical protein CEXT_465081 [Caerostris extrusa]